MTLLANVRANARVVDGATQTADLSLSAEVCVIGSGAGGAVSAKVFAEAGHDVLIVEEGGYFTNADFTMSEADVYPKLYQEALQRSTSDQAISILQGRAVGGTTVVNWTTSFRTPEDVIEYWKKAHGVGGFTLADLVPHYEVMEDRLCIDKVPVSFMNANNKKLYDGCQKLGWQVDTLKRNVYACLRSGYCGMGCPYNAKRSMLVTCIPDAIDAGARLVFRCRIDKLLEKGGEIESASGRLLDPSGRTPTGRNVTIKAKKFILSGGAINSPALLLRSAINDHDLVGRRTFLHPTTATIAEYDEPIEASYGAPQSAASHHFAHRGEDVGVFLEAAPLHPILGSTTLPGFGATHEETMTRFKTFGAHIALAIDGFHEEGGRVTLRPSGTPKLDYPIGPKLWEAFRFGNKRLAELQFAGGAKRVGTLHEGAPMMTSPDQIGRIDDQKWQAGSVALFTAHQMGGCRMGDHEAHAVVRSEDLRHHRLRNLHIIDGSVFPTGLGVNPQESIYGLAHLIASRLAGNQASSRPTASEVAREITDVYSERCAACHGVQGRGDGPASVALTPRPRNFTDAKWQASTDDARLEKVIREGGPAVGESPAMVGNADLKPETVKALVGQIRAFRQEH